MWEAKCVTNFAMLRHSLCRSRRCTDACLEQAPHGDVPEQASGLPGVHVPGQAFGLPGQPGMHVLEQAPGLLGMRVPGQGPHGLATH